MMEEAQKAGLSLKLHDVKMGMPNAEVTGSLGKIWWLFEILPISRRSYLTDGVVVLKR
jgi:hypothetical protein